MKPESQILKDSMLAASENGAKVFRNNTGTAWQGEPVWLKNGDLLLRNPRIVHFGLCTGSSDLIGWRPLMVTQEMVGKPTAQFVAIETKTQRGRATEAQNNFLRRVAEAGGCAILSKSYQDVEKELKRNDKK